MLSAEEENTLLDLHNSLYHTTAESNGCLFKIFPTLTKHAKLDQRKVPVFITCLILACSSAVLGYEGMFILANILQIAVVNPLVVFLLFLLCFWAVVRLFLQHKT